MNAAVISRQGDPVSPNIDAVSDWPEPNAPAPGEVRLRVEATALNHMDLWVGRGLPGIPLTWPRISGCDVCGTVEAVGEGVDPSWKGRRVIMDAAVRQPDRVLPDDPPGSSLAPEYKLLGEHHNGGHCAFFNAPANQLAAIGDADPVQAAAFGLTFLTAWGMLRKAELRPGQTVLVTGIGGGVATAALKIAKHMGCEVAVTSRHAWKLEKAQQLGADHTILDKGEDWSRDSRRITNKRGFDVAVDSIGKATHLWCIKSLARGGCYVTCGATTGADATTDLARVFWNQLRILGSTMGSIDEFKEIVSLFRAGQLKPVVDSVHPWTDARKAWQRLEAGEQFGNIVLTWQ
jgi:NADPH:quinone reductase-like Zn-dependent oxidoreductase